MSRLTVILTLRGRPLHTLRWMWHANRVKLPFYIIVADGEVHPTVDRVLSDPCHFPNLNYGYYRYADHCFADFYKKCRESAAKVKTPYVMMSDNDDFLFVTGIGRSIAHLEHAADYVCAGGQIPSFSVSSRPGGISDIVGDLTELKFGYAQGPPDIAHALRSERVKDVLNRYYPSYYHVFRAPALRLMFEEAERLAFTDLTIHEYFLAARAVTLGKVKTDPSNVSYIRQRGTSLLRTYYPDDWVHSLLRNDLPGDCRKMAAVLSGEIEKLEGFKRNTFVDLVLDAHANRLRTMLGHTMMRHRFPKLFKVKRRLSWVNELSLLPRRLRKQWNSRVFWFGLSLNCPDKDLLSKYHAELNEIALSIQGDAFLSFIKLHAPELNSFR